MTLVSFTISPDHVDDGQTSVFNVSVSGGTPPYRYDWHGLPPSQDWAVCLPANRSEIACTAGVPGAYSIAVYVTDSAGRTVQAGSLPLTVAEPIGSLAEATPRTGTIPLAISFSDSGSGGTPPYTFQWIFGDGSQSNVANTTHIYTVAGTYVAWGCMGDALQTPICSGLVVRALAPLSATLSAGAGEVVVGGAAYLNATATGGLPNLTFAWSPLPPGCVSQNASRLVCFPAAPGTYTVEVEVTDSLGHSATALVQLRVSPPPLTSNGNAIVWTLGASVIALSAALAALVFVVARMRRRQKLP